MLIKHNRESILTNYFTYFYYHHKPNHMTLAEKISEIELYYNYWIGNYNRKEKTNNNVRIVAEAITKSIILHKKNEFVGTNIILGKDILPRQNRTSRRNSKLSLAELVQVLREINIFPGQNNKEENLFELVRGVTNKGSHSTNRQSDLVSIDDLEICKTSLEQLIKWLFLKILNIPISTTISQNFSGIINSELYDEAADKFNNFEIACAAFDKRKYQYLLISPQKVSENKIVSEAIAKLPWRLVIDFNPKSDEEHNGLLYNFNENIGPGYKKTFTINDKIEFDPSFEHYWYMANGQGTTAAIGDFRQWKNTHRTFLSSVLYKEFVSGSRIKPRIVVLLDIDAKYAEFIISELNRIDYSKLHFVLCSETEKYENIFDSEDNVTLINISADDISTGLLNSVNYDEQSTSGQKYLIPHFDERKTYLEISQDHFDYLSSLGVEIVYKDIETNSSNLEDNGFFRGDIITWRDLAEQKDILRNSLENIQKRLLNKLKENKLDEVHLVHEAGAGGTTLARRIAYNFSSLYPTIILRQYHHRKTIEAIRIIYDQYTKGSLPLLIIAESFEVRDNHLLYRDLSSAKKNAVLFIINRGSINIASNARFILRSQLEVNEAMAFQNTFSLIVPDRKSAIGNIQSDYRDKPKYITPILYGLTAFGKDFTGLEGYVVKGLEGLNLEQKKFMGFVSLIYYYTQKSVAAELFSSLFNVPVNECDLVKILGTENPLLELLHEEGDDYDYNNVWRPRYALVAEEAMHILLGGGTISKRNWKNNLAGWLIDLIYYVRLNLEFLDDETLDIFNSLFIERLAIEEEGQDKEFTKALNDILSPQNGIAIFEALTDAYPNEAHFHGHFARYLYNDRIGIKQYDRAIIEAEKSLEIYSNNASLIHTLGMCYREKAENLIYTFEQQGIPKDEAEEKVKLLTEQASETFDRCIDEDPSNLYGYESQIRIILKSLEFGARIHNATSKESFITDPKYNWYAEYLDKVSRLLDEALFVIEQAMRLENRERIMKSAGYIFDCEGMFFRTLGRHLQAKNKFESLIKATPKGYEYMRPHYRRMFVISLLAGKLDNQRDLFSAWKKISESELNQCVQYLDANIFEDPNNTQNIRLWLQAVRNQRIPPAIQSCIAKISSWTQVTNQNTNTLLEGYYYLYVLTSISAISDGEIFNPTSVQTVNDIKEKMKPFLKNEIFSYEWYGRGDGIKKMVNHKQLGEFSSDFFERNKDILGEVTGRIKHVNSSQKGTIKLDCGLEAFFVPNVGGFTDRNTNDRIKCYVSFRYDQMQAWSVILYSDQRENNLTKDSLELHDLIVERDDLVIQGEDQNSRKVVAENEVTKIKHPIIVGKLDLNNSKVETEQSNKKRISPANNVAYKGKIKLLNISNGYIYTDILDKDVAFNISHLNGLNFRDLAKNKEVTVLVSFIDGYPKLDNNERNYIAKEVRL